LLLFPSQVIDECKVRTSGEDEKFALFRVNQASEVCLAGDKDVCEGRTKVRRTLRAHVRRRDAPQRRISLPDSYER
jgi:hypothetical protein